MGHSVFFAKLVEIMSVNGNVCYGPKRRIYLSARYSDASQQGYGLGPASEADVYLFQGLI
jgi:hypothetical protein